MARKIVCVVIVKFTFATVVLYMANTQAVKPSDMKKPANNPGKPDTLNLLKVSFLYVKNKKTPTVKKQKIDLYKSICYKSEPSKDLTSKPP